MIDPEQFARPLAENVKSLREARGFTQAQLAQRAGVPRATLSLLESGVANPTLSVVLRVCQALEVRLEEVLESRAPSTQVFRKGELAERVRRGVTVRKLLPEHVEGLEIEQLHIPAGASMSGVPHAMGTREYLSVDTGVIELQVAGVPHELRAGDVAVFLGNQKHSYRNPGRSAARGYSVIALGHTGPALR